jgi:flagellar biosynthetic protein FliR
MTDIVTLSATEIQAFLLALLRTGGFVAAAPALSHRFVPVPVRIGLSLALAWALAPQVMAGMPAPPEHLAGLAVLGIRETLTGVVIGFVFSLLFSGLQAAGEIVGLQVGFGLANVYDTSSEQQIGVLGQFELILGMLLFFAMDGHHLMLRAFFDSYRVVGPNGLQLGAGGLESIIRLSGTLFVIAIKAASPVLAAVFLTEIALGITARTVPQMNVFIVGFPLKIGVGLFVLAGSLPLLSSLLGKLLLQLSASLDGLMVAMGTR